MTLVIWIVLFIAAIYIAYQVGCWYAGGYTIATMHDREEINKAVQQIKRNAVDKGPFGGLMHDIMLQGIWDAVKERIEEGTYYR